MTECMLLQIVTAICEISFLQHVFGYENTMMVPHNTTLPEFLLVTSFIGILVTSRTLPKMPGPHHRMLLAVGMSSCRGHIH